MRTIAWSRLKAFSEIHKDAEIPLRSWFNAMQRGRFRNFAELKRTFGSVDKVGAVHVFNIGGNKYRLVVSIAYRVQQCYIKAAMTHSEYDEEKWK